MQRCGALVLSVLLVLPACEKSSQPAKPEGAQAGGASATPEAGSRDAGASQEEATRNALKLPLGATSSTGAEKNEVSLPSGLRYKILKEGSGAKPRLGTTVKAHVVGKLPDGATFLDTRSGGVPEEYRVDKLTLIEGLVVSFLDMKPGEKRWIHVPSRLGYGRKGYAGLVPPNTDLDLEVELVSAGK